MSVWLVSSGHDLIFNGELVNVKFVSYILFSNMSTLFNAEINCKMYLFAWHSSSDLDIIFLVHWSMFSFLS